MTTMFGSAAAPIAFAQGISMHGVVLSAFCAFLAVQFYLYWHHRRTIARHRRTLNALWQQGGAPEQELSQGKTDQQWLGWVATRFHDGAFHDGHYSREDALAQLDNWLEGHGSYLLLQRMGLMASLLGLLLTVGGFMFIELPVADALDLRLILATLTPLILGVGTGASLAFINQVLLHLAGNGTDTVRTAACRWFDGCVWKHVQVKPHVAANDAAEALQAMGATIRGSVAQYQGATTAIRQTAQFLQDAGTALVNTAERLGADTAASSEEMKALRGTATSVIRSMGEIVPNIERTTSELAESVGAFKSVVQEQFGEAAARHRESAELLAGSVDQIRESASQLSGQFSSFGQIIKAQAAASQAWSSSLENDVLPAQRAFQQSSVQILDATKDLAPAQRAFREAVDSMQGSANGLAAFVRDGVEPATQRLAELNQVLARMQETTAAVREMAQLRQEFAGLARNLAQAAAAADAIRSLPQEIRTVLLSVARSHNGDAGSRRPFFLRLFSGFGSQGRSNHNGRP